MQLITSTNRVNRGSLSQIPEIGVMLTDLRLINQLKTAQPLLVKPTLSKLGWLAMPFAEDLAYCKITRFHIGNEFCERLLPSTSLLQEAVNWCQHNQLGITLVTPMLADQGISRLTELLARIPDGSEVVFNDFGVLRLITDKFNSLIPVAGRQMCKMIKDPRLPSADWANTSPPGAQSGFFPRLMQRLGVNHHETEVRPFAQITDFQPNGLDLGVHLPFGYTLKGRICKPGSTHLAKKKKFTPGHPCSKECLSYFSKMERLGTKSSHEPDTFLRGNTVFYRYRKEQEAVLTQAVNQGWISRIILSGDWNENRRPH